MNTNNQGPSMRLTLHGPCIGDPDVVITVELTKMELGENSELVKTYEWTGSFGEGITGGKFTDYDSEHGLGWAMDQVVQSLFNFHSNQNNPHRDEELFVVAVDQYGAKLDGPWCES